MTTYTPTDQLKTNSTFICAIGAATGVSTTLAMLAGQTHTQGQPGISATLGLASLAPNIVVGYLALKTKLQHNNPIQPTELDESGPADPLEELWLLPTRSEAVACDRGGSPTIGRECLPEHNIEANARAALGDDKYEELSKPKPWLLRASRSVDALGHRDTPVTIIGSWVAVVLIAVAVFA